MVTFGHVKRIKTSINSIFYSVIEYKGDILGFGRRHYGPEDTVIKVVKMNKTFDIIDDNVMLLRGEDPRCFIYRDKLYVLNNLCNRMTLIDYENKSSIRIPANGKNVTFIPYGNKLYYIHYMKPLKLFELNMDEGFIRHVEVLDDSEKTDGEEPLYRGGTPGYKLNEDEFYGYGHKTYKVCNTLKHDIYKWVINFKEEKPVITIEDLEQPINSKNICDPTSVIEIDGKKYLVTAESDKPWFCTQDYVTNVYEIDGVNKGSDMIYGQVEGRFFLEQDLGIVGDNKPSTFTLSELIETFPQWKQITETLRKDYNTLNLCTMFETDDVHPYIISQMKLFDTVFVPYPFLRDILIRNGVNCVSLDWWTSSFLRSKPQVKPKIIDKNRIIFLYNGTNDVRKNVITLTRIFTRALDGTDHTLIVKTNKNDNLCISKNIKVITDRLSNEKLTVLFNMSDYCVTCTRGEGVGLLHLESKYFNKPIISHNKGVFADLGVDIITLPSTTTNIDYTHVPEFLKQVFYGKWWEVDENESVQIIKSLLHNHTGD